MTLGIKKLTRPATTCALRAATEELYLMFDCERIANWHLQNIHSFTLFLLFHFLISVLVMFGVLHFTEMPIKCIHGLHTHSRHNDRIYKYEMHGLQTFTTAKGEENPPLLGSRMQQHVFNE